MPFVNESVARLVIAVDAPLPAESRARLAALSPRVRVVDGLDPSTLAMAEIVYLGKGRVDPAAAPRLRWVQCNSAGIAAHAGTALARSGVPLASASGAYSTTVAEMAIALLLALQRRLLRCFELQQRREWRGDVSLLYGYSLRGRTMGIVGYGSIGRELARLAHALGMRVLAAKRRPHERHEHGRFILPGTGDPDGTIPEAWFGLGELRAMLPACDVLAIALPGTSHTAGAISRAELAALPRHALVLNVGRGAVLDETALMEALQAGRLAGAGLDVFDEEPLPPSHPLWTTPGVIISPHLGSTSVNQSELAAEVLIENVRRDLASEPLLNRVDFALGY